MKKSYVIEIKEITIGQIIEKYIGLLCLIAFVSIGLTLNDYNLYWLNTTLKLKPDICTESNADISDCNPILLLIINKIAFFNLVIKYYLIICIGILISYDWIKNYSGPHVKIELILFICYWFTILLDCKNLILYNIISNSKWNYQYYDEFLMLNIKNLDIIYLMYLLNEIIIICPILCMGIVVILFGIGIILNIIFDFIFEHLNKFYQQIRNVKIKYNEYKEVLDDRIV